MGCNPVMIQRGVSFGRRLPPWAHLREPMSLPAIRWTWFRNALSSRSYFAGSFGGISCWFAIFISLLVPARAQDALSSSPFDPSQLGPYPVGQTTDVIRDPDRLGGWTRTTWTGLDYGIAPSMNLNGVKGAGRQVMLDIFYPADGKRISPSTLKANLRSFTRVPTGCLVRSRVNGYVFFWFRLPPGARQARPAPPGTGSGDGSGSWPPGRPGRSRPGPVARGPQGPPPRHRTGRTPVPPRGRWSG